MSATHLRQMLKGVSHIPTLRRKYRSFLDPKGPLSLQTLPTLTRREFSDATDELLRGGGQEAGSVVVGGGKLTSPNLSVVPEDMFVQEVTAAWQPLDSGDLLGNLFSANACPSHVFYNRLAAAAGATVLPVGALPDSRLDRWLEAFEERGGTALAVSPMTLRRLLVRAAAGRRPLRSVRKLLIGGPYHDPTPTAEIARLLPDVEVWQLYGSFEAWVVGQRGPGCADGVFHLLPHQYAEIDAGRILVTTVGVPRTPPVIRYVIGDRGRFAACGCGRPDPAILIEGPLAPSVRVNGHLVLAQELVDLALETGEVLDAQVAVVETSGGSDRVELRVRLIEGVPDDQYTLEWIKYQALNGHLALDPNSADHADALQVVAVDRLPEYEPTGAATAR